MDNVKPISLSGLCTGCGTCSGICPVKAIEMRVLNGVFLPVVLDEKCIKCGACVNCCPVCCPDSSKLNSEVFGKQPKDVFLGNYLKCYVGHSNDCSIRLNSTSGGTASQLLIYALEKGIIDGVLVAKMNADRPLEPEPFIARSKAEIMSAAKSKYCPVPLNQALEEILAKEGRFAVVGLPCHMYGVRKAEIFSEELKQKIVLHVGLFCGHTVNFFGTECVLRKLGVDMDNVVSIDYRGHGWPGCMRVKVKDGKNLIVRFNRNWNAYWNIFAPFFFTPWCCLMCADQFNELADVSVGDAWLPELVKRGSAESLIIIRTEVADNLFKQIESDEILSLKPVLAKTVKNSQAFSLNFKKEKIASRLYFFRVLGKRVINFKIKPEFPHLLDILSALLPYVSYIVSSNSHFRSLLCYVPLPVFRLYFGLFRVVFSLT